jgi:hypothetical protein
MGEMVILDAGQGSWAVPLDELRRRTKGHGAVESEGAGGGKTGGGAASAWVGPMTDARVIAHQSPSHVAAPGGVTGRGDPVVEPASSIPFRWFRDRAVVPSEKGDALEILEVVGTAVG